MYSYDPEDVRARSESSLRQVTKINIDHGSHNITGRVSEVTRVSEPACFGAAPAPGIFYPEPAPAPGKREHDFGIFEN